MSDVSFFTQLLRNSRQIGKDDFAVHFGAIPDDIAEMLKNERASELSREVRSRMESASPLAGNLQRLRLLDFGRFENAPELAKGEVAAVDGTPVLPTQRYSVGQALCVGVGSVSHLRPLLEDMHYWSSKAHTDVATNVDEYTRRVADGVFRGINSTAFLRFFEVKHGLQIAEKHVFFDGALIYEWLLNIKEGENLYHRLFAGPKKYIGVIKNIHASPSLAFYARALRPGEAYIVETFHDHMQRQRGRAAEGGGGRAAEGGGFPGDDKILRGVFKPSKKPFGFEVHIDHLDDMLRIMSADCQMNNVGHEIPYLLNRVDEEVRHNFSQRLLKNAVAGQLAMESEELFFEEEDERNLR